MINYVIRHPHATQKYEAIASLYRVIDALNLDLPVPVRGDKTAKSRVDPQFEALIIHGKNSISAVIHTYDRPAVDLDLPWLTVSESDDRWDSDSWF